MTRNNNKFQTKAKNLKKVDKIAASKVLKDKKNKNKIEKILKTLYKY